MSETEVSFIQEKDALPHASALQHDDTAVLSDVGNSPEENNPFIKNVGSKITDAFVLENTAMCKKINTIEDETAISEVHSKSLCKTLANGDVLATTAAFTWHITNKELCKEERLKSENTTASFDDFSDSPSHCMVTRKIESRRPSSHKALLSNKRSKLNPTVTVDVSVCDKTLPSQIENAVGISVLYFCKKCRRHSSTSLAEVSDHAMTCDTTTVVCVKRKRGRPRLNCTDSHKAALETATDSGDGQKGARTCGGTVSGDSLPRKRGRPRRKRSRSVDNDNHTHQGDEKPLNDDGWTESCVTETVPVKTEPQDANAGESPMNDAEHNYATSDGGDACASDSDTKVDVRHAATNKEEESVGVKDEETEDATGGYGEPREPRRWFCSSCPSTLLHSSAELQIHRQCHVSTDDGSVSLNCYICGADWQTHRSHRWYVIKRHLRLVHHVDFRLACDMCDDVTFRDHESLTRHVKRAHKRRCRFRTCKFSATAHDIETHERCHDDSDPSKFRCYLCGYRPRITKRPWFILHSHLVTSHPGVIRALYQCRTCDRGFQEMQKLVAHAASCCSTNKLTCIVCAQKIHPKGMVSHMRSHVDRQATGDAVGTTAVKTEGKDSDQDNDSTTEGGQDADKKVHTCSQHRVSFATQDELTQHFVEVHWGLTKDGATGLPASSSSGDVSEKQIKCPFCYKKFATFERFELHAQYVHAPDKMGNALCNTCGKKFLNGTRLRNHVREVHEGKRRTRAPPKRGPGGGPVKYHMCDKCVYSTPILLRLRNHYMSEHEGIHPYACDRCDYKTNEKSDLRRHKLKHFGLKRYWCEHCPYKTDTRWVLVKHCHSQHGIELPRRSRNTLGCRTSKRRLNKKSERQAETVVALLPGDAGLVLPGNPDGFRVHPTDQTRQTYHVLEQGNESHIQILSMDETLPTFDVPQGHELATNQLQQYRVIQSTSQFEHSVVTAPDAEQELHVVTSGDASDLVDDSGQQYEVVSTGGSQLAAGQRFQIVTDADGVQQIQVVMDAESELLGAEGDYQVVNIPQDMQEYDQEAGGDITSEYQLVQGVVPSIASQEVIIDCGDTVQDRTEDGDQVVYAVGQSESEAAGKEAGEATLLLLTVSPDDVQ